MRDGALMRRMLIIRQFPLFARSDLGELAQIAENVVEHSFARGDVVAAAEPLSSLHLVVTGHLAYGDRVLSMRDVHGAIEIAAGCPACAPAVALVPSRTLELAASDYFDFLEESFQLLLATLRDLAARMIAFGPLRPAAPPARMQLGLVDRIILLRQLLPFASAHLEPLASLAHAADEVDWDAGAVVQRTHALAEHALVLVDGALRDDAGASYGPGQALGLLEMIAALPHASTLAALTRVRALVTRATTLHDVLEDHTELALAILRAFARAIIDHDVRTRCAVAQETVVPRWNGS